MQSLTQTLADTRKGFYCIKSPLKEAPALQLCPTALFQQPGEEGLICCYTMGVSQLGEDTWQEKRQKVLLGHWGGEIVGLKCFVFWRL